MQISEIIRYVQVTVGVAFLFFIPTMLIRRVYLRKRRRSMGIKKEVAVDLFIFYILCLFQITALRFGGIGWDIEHMINRQTRVNLMPFVELINWVNKGVWWHLFYNVLGNCIWFIPFGTLLPAIFKSKRRFWKVLLIGALTSTSIEALQFILCTGVTDIDDVIMNTLGSGMGYGIWLMLDSIRHKFLRV